jgi:hypothetical protein
MCSTWVSGGSLPAASALSSLSRRAPWLPPVTRMVVFVRVEPERCGGLFAVRQLHDFRAHRRAGGHGFAPREKRLRRIETEENLGAKAAGQHVGSAGPGVGIMDEGFEAELVAGIDRRQRGEAAHAEHGIRPKPRRIALQWPTASQVFQETAASAARVWAVSPRRAPSQNAGADILRRPRHPPSFRKSTAAPHDRGPAAPRPRRFRETNGRRCRHRRSGC